LVTVSCPVSEKAIPKGLRKPKAHNRIAGTERVVARDGAVRVVAQDLAADVGCVLRGAGGVLLAEGDVELAVGPEREAAALVATVAAGGQLGDLDAER
jgi:hypothetical protein